MRRQLRLLCLVTLGAVSSFSYAEDFSYVTNGEAITITGYTGTVANLIIPVTINGLPVKSIGWGAFSGCTNLASVTMPEGITDVADYAFYGCTSLNLLALPNSLTNIGQAAFFQCTDLENLILPTSLESIGNNAFALCSSLTSIVLPANVSTLGNGVFYNCNNLQSLTVDLLDAYYNSIDGVLFNKDQTTLVEWPEGKGQSYTIPKGVSAIGNSAFYNRTTLRNIDIPESVTNIEDFAFCGCVQLSSIILPQNLRTLGGAALSYCYGLTNIFIPSALTQIGPGAFNVDISLNSIEVEAGNPSYSSLDGVLFDKPQSALIQFPLARGGSYQIPSTVVSVASWAFAGAGLTSVEIPDSVNHIYNHAFAGCNFLKYLRLSANLVDIESMAFDYCYDLPT